MADFTPITSQEEFDAAIKERLRREREKYADYDDLKAKSADHEKTVADYARQLSEANAKIEGHDKAVADLNAKIKGYETASAKTRIALETGLPYEMASRLTGETEDDIKRDAANLAKLIGKQNPPAPPLRSTEGNGGNSKDTAYKSLLNNLKEE